MEKRKFIKIAVVGPESTGKSTIARQLAAYYDTVCVPEYAREYCKDLNRAYTLKDELNIFYGQLKLEKDIATSAQHNLLFCDTMVLTVKIWCDHLFGSTPAVVLDTLKEQDYDYFLLMNIDLPWQDDELRDFPDLREYFMDVWHGELKKINANYAVISGLGERRFKAAKAAVGLFLSAASA